MTDSGGPADTAATVQGVAVDQLFTLVLKTPATEERYELVTVADGTVVGGSNRIDRAMAGSVLARTGPLPANRPDADTYEVDIDIDVGGLRLVATDVTRWANGITAGVSHPPDPDPATTAAANAQGVTPADLFTLVLSTPATVERYPLVTVVNGTPAGASNRIDRAMAGSLLARVDTDSLPTARPGEGTSEPSYKPNGVFGVDGSAPDATDYLGSANGKTGMHALLKADLFNLLCLPPTSPAGDLPEAVWAHGGGLLQ